MPIVFVNVGDPVAAIVDSLARPGGNATGFSYFEFGWREVAGAARRSHLARRVAVLGILRKDGSVERDQAVAPSFKVELSVVACATPARLTRRHRIRALPEWSHDRTASTSAVVHRNLITMLATRHGLPAVYSFRNFVTAGGLISYGPDTIDPLRRAAIRRPHPQRRSPPTCQCRHR